MRTMSLLSGLCLGAMLAVQSVQGAGGPVFNPKPVGFNLYVSPKGDDANGGWDANNPLRTPWAAQKALLPRRPCSSEPKQWKRSVLLGGWAAK